MALEGALEVWKLYGDSPNRHFVKILVKMTKIYGPRGREVSDFHICNSVVALTRTLLRNFIYGGEFTVMNFVISCH